MADSPPPFMVPKISRPNPDQPWDIFPLLYVLSAGTGAAMEYITNPDLTSAIPVPATTTSPVSALTCVSGNSELSFCCSTTLGSEDWPNAQEAAARTKAETAFFCIETLHPLGG